MKILAALVLAASLSVAAAAHADTLEGSPSSVFRTSLVGTDGKLMQGSEGYRLAASAQGLLPDGWRMVFMDDDKVGEFIAWPKGMRWTEVLDRWGKANSASVLVDGGKKTVLVGRVTATRGAGVTMVSSNSTISTDINQLEQAYDAVNVANQRRLVRNEQLESQRKLRESQNSAPKGFDGPAPINGMPSGQSAQGVVSKGNFTENPITQTVSFHLKKGLLKPQMVELLTNHPGIKSANAVQWNASETYMWVSDFTVTRTSIDQIINDILNSYQLHAAFKGNGMVVISKLK